MSIDPSRPDSSGARAERADARSAGPGFAPPGGPAPGGPAPDGPAPNDPAPGGPAPDGLAPDGLSANAPGRQGPVAADSGPARPSAGPGERSPSAHPGLHAIAAVEAAKGALALSAASGLELLGPAPLQRWIGELIRRFHLDPDHGALAWLARSISPHSVHLAAAIALAYGLLHLLEAWGLWKAKAWASWLGAVGAALYLPFDVYALFQHPGWLAVAVLAINLIVVWVLARDLLQRRR